MIFKDILNRLIISALMLAFSVLPLLASSKKNVIDSLENRLLLPNITDSTKVNLLNQLTYKLYSSNKDAALNYALEAGEIARKINYTTGLATNLRLTGICYAYRSEYLKAVTYYNKAIELSKRTNNQKELALSLNGMGNYYRNKGDFKQAENNYNQALKILTQIDDKESAAVCYNNLGLIYIRQANYAPALDYMLQSLQINEELQNQKRISICLNNIGLIYDKQAEYAKALEYFNKALVINKRSNNKRGIYIRLNNIGAIYSKQGKYELALDQYQEAYTIAKQLNDKRGLSKCLNHIGIAYMHLDDDDNALEYFTKAMTLKKELNEKQGISLTHYYLGSVYLNHKNYHKALEHTSQSLKIAEKLSLLENQQNAYEQLSKIHEELGNYQIALQNHQIYKTLYDSIFNEQNIKELTDLENKYIYEKEKQLLELKQQKRDALIAEETQKQKIISNSLIGGVILMTLLLIVILRSFMQKRSANIKLTKQKEEIKNQAAELKQNNLKLEELNLFKQDMTNMIIHDLKSPLSSIINVKQLNNKEGLELVQQSGYRMLNLIQNILGVYKYQDAKIKLNKSKFSIAQLLKSSLKEVKLMMESKSVKVILEDSFNVELEADKDLTKRVFINLISNAIKFSPSNSSIYIRTEIPKQNIKIHIINSGPAIPIEDQTTIFERFNQYEKRKSGNIESTGLGLTFCKMVIEAHGGNIGVVSVPNEDVDFWFTLPSFQKDKIQQLTLNDDDKAYLQPFAIELKNLQTYEVSKINLILKQIKPNNERITKWIKDLEQSVYSNEQDTFQNLLQMITK